MDEIILAISVSFMAFLSTSIDNLFLLVTLSLHPKYGAAKVRAGYMIAVILMLVIAHILAQSARLIPTEYIHYIGLVPLAIGAYELYQLVTRKTSPADEIKTDLIRGSGSIWAIVVIMLTHSWDSIGVLAPLFVDTRSALIPWMYISVVVTAAFIIFAGQSAVSFSKLRNILVKIAPKILPFLLMGVGVYILTNTPTDVTL
ncbi:MAG: cadmium resistance transporter [Sneathiella sp.]|uniref:cadmium resistance transporter n=1 Tax=Sneathiella sp. TaxID=1964365 RepID=UPI003001D36D